MARMMKLVTAVMLTIFHIAPDVCVEAAAVAAAVAKPNTNPSPDPAAAAAAVVVAVARRQARESEYPPIRMHLRRLQFTGSAGSPGGSVASFGGDDDGDDDDDADSSSNSSENGRISFDIPLDQIGEDVRIAVPSTTVTTTTDGIGIEGAGAEEGEEEGEEVSEGMVLREATLIKGVAGRPEVATTQMSGVWVGYLSGGPEQADEIRCRLTLEGEPRVTGELNVATALEEWARPGEIWPMPKNWTGVTCVVVIYR